MNVKQRRKGLLACLFSAAVLLPGLAMASHSVSLPGSNFEIDDDANFIVDHPAPSIDWVSGVSAGLVVVTDQATGSDDDSFKGGTKEDSIDPQTTTGSIPNNKSDLKNFGVYQERSVDGDFLHLFWTRVQDPSGTTLMDFELNSGADGLYPPTSTGAQFPVRRAGDLLIEYKLAQGGVTPELFMYSWLLGPADGSCEASNAYPCWGEQVNLSAANIAIGSINHSLVASGAVGIGDFDPYTFGEASIDLSAIFPPGECRSFGFASLKSRSSDSFSAQMKDFIAPYPVNISNCANINVKKTDDQEPAQPLPGAVFRLYHDNGDVAGAFDAADEAVASVQDQTTDAFGEAGWIDIFAGAYCVVEITPPLGHSLPPAPDYYWCFQLNADSSQSFTFVNPQIPARIDILKKDDAVPANLLAGAEFTLFNDDGSVPGAHDASDTSTGRSCTTDAAGSCSITDILPPGDYCVVETQTPLGHDTAAPQCVSLSLDQTLALEFVNPRQPARINILKKDDAEPANLLIGAGFTLFRDDGSEPGAYDAGDTSTGKSCTTDASGECSITDILPPGAYCVVETQTPSGHDTAPAQCLSLSLNETVNLVFIDPRQPASVVIRKKDDDGAGNPLAGAEFTLFSDDGSEPGAYDAGDSSTGKSCTTDASGSCTIDNILPPGGYCLVETVTPAGYATAAPQCVSLALNQTLELTFVDPRLRGAILITKTRKHAADGPGDHPHAGVTFTVSGGGLAEPVVVNTNAQGQACVDGLLLSGFFGGDYTVTETLPTGYVPDGDLAKFVTVDNAASCADTPYVGETVAFANTPLSNITVSFHSQIEGGTLARISCGQAANPVDPTPTAFDDVAETSVNLKPGTYTCIVEIDP